MSELNPKKYIGKRIAATIIDYSIVLGITWLYITTFGTEEADGKYTVTGFLALVPFIFWSIYFIVCESYLGGTLGHLLFNLKVISINGQAPTLGQTILRRISDALEIVWCFGLIAFILVKNNSQAQRLGDTWGKTLVVGKNDQYVYGQFDFEKHDVKNGH